MTIRSVAAPLLWSAFVAVPARWEWLDGIPLGPLEAAALALVWWIWAVDPRGAGARTAAALILVKLALGAVAVDHGFEGRYYANDAWTPPIEPSTEFRGRPFTRLDERLSFGEGEPDLPLHFLNHLRFNFYLPDQPRASGCRTRWSGTGISSSKSVDRRRCTSSPMRRPEVN